MAHTIANMDHSQIDDQAMQAVSNPWANAWLVVLGLCLLGTLICSAVLMAWPIVAHLVAG